MDNKKLKITDGEIEITLKCKKEITPIELQTKAGIMLLEHVQYKYFEEQLGIKADEKFMEFIKEMDETVKGIKIWSGLIIEE